MIKKIVALLMFLWSFSAQAVFADSNLTVNCYLVEGSGDCSVSPKDTPLFEIGDMKPGYRFYRNLTVINESLGDDCHFYLSSSENGDSILKSVLHNEISRGSSVVYQNTLASLFGEGAVFIETIPAGETYDYQWLLEMAESADDDYQDKSLSFDFTLGFECGQEPEQSIPTPTTSLTTTTDDGTGGGDECTDTVPGVPTNLTAEPAGSGEVLLSWLPPEQGPVTGYLIAYGDSPGDYKYGNPNVSGSPYLVTQLTPGNEYYFVVRAKNGCAADSPFSDPASALAGGVFAGEVVEGPAPGFEVLGENQNASEEGEIGGGVSTGVAGATTQKVCYWSLVFSFFALILSALILSRFKKRQKRQVLVPVVLFVLAYLADRYMHNWYSPSLFCNWLWLIALVLFFLTWLFWRHKSS